MHLSEDGEIEVVNLREWEDAQGRTFSSNHADFVRLLEYSDEAKKHALGRGHLSKMITGLGFRVAPAGESLEQL